MAEDKTKSGTEKTHTGKYVTIKLPKINFWVVSTMIFLATSLISVVLLLNQGLLPTGSTGIAGAAVLTANDAANKAIDYINKNLVQTGGVTLVSSEEFTKDMYKVTSNYQGSDIDVYVTKDGTWLFISSPLDITKSVTATTTTAQPKKTCEDMTKAADAKLEAFVVSYCPYGLQMQRILAEVVKNIPSLADNIKVRYIGAVSNGQVTSMHGQTEATENLRQICIREEQPDKYWSYVSCFMKNQDSSDSCLTSAGVDKTKLTTCMGSGGKGVQYAQQDFSLQDTYGVSGSPTLILNGETVSEFDFGGRTADAVKTLLCCGFTQAPTDCSTALSTAQAATSFATSYSSSSGSSGNTTCG